MNKIRELNLVNHVNPVKYGSFLEFAGVQALWVKEVEIE
jgi:hypothetical protein